MMCHMCAAVQLGLSARTSLQASLHLLRLPAKHCTSHPLQRPEPVLCQCFTDFWLISGNTNEEQRSWSKILNLFGGNFSFL